MENVSQEFLAYLASTNNEVLNQKALQTGDYDIKFELNGTQYEFSQKNGYFQWKYYQT